MHYSRYVSSCLFQRMSLYSHLWSQVNLLCSLSLNFNDKQPFDIIQKILNFVSSFQRRTYASGIWDDILSHKFFAVASIGQTRICYMFKKLNKCIIDALCLALYLVCYFYLQFRFLLVQMIHPCFALLYVLCVNFIYHSNVFWYNWFIHSCSLDFTLSLVTIMALQPVLMFAS